MAALSPPVVSRARLRLAKVEELAAIVKLETESYPADEMATPEKLQYRLEAANAFFWVCETTAGDGEVTVAGYVCGTLLHGQEMTEESMDVGTHEPSGNLFCVHSVVTTPALRRNGIAAFMVKEVIRRVARGGALARSGAGGVAAYAAVDTMALLSKPGNCGLYAGCGFRSVGMSPISHGEDQWVEMRLWLSPLSPHGAGGVARLASSPYCPDYALVPLLQVDAFASTAFSGNPAAVMVLPAVTADDEPSAAPLKAGAPSSAALERWMADSAVENNLSETAFIRCLPDGRWSLRWFTPGGEVDLCGHATVAAAASLWQGGFIPRGQAAVTFVSLRGELGATRPSEVLVGHAEGHPVIQLDFPSVAPHPLTPTEAATAESQLLDQEVPGPATVLETVAVGLGLPAVAPDAVAAAAAAAAGAADDDEAGGSALVLPPPFEAVERNDMDLMVQVTPEAFVALSPVPGVLKRLAVRGVIVTAAGSAWPAVRPLRLAADVSDVAFVSRFFCPRLNIAEDPVTGSAHCCLAPHWSQLLGCGSQWMQARQCSARGGTLAVKATGDRVNLQGVGRLVVRGVALSPPPLAAEQ